MSAATPAITAIRTARIHYELDVPIVYGTWVMRHREFVLVRIDADDGSSGFAYCLTRDGPVPEIVARSIAPRYVGASAVEPQAAFFDALYSNHAVHAAGIGMRSLSLVDIAAWDLACKINDVPIAAALGAPDPVQLPATAIVGYPPSLGPDAVAAQVTNLWAAGWRRFKVPIAPDLDASVDRLRAARASAPAGWVGFDANMVFRTAEDVARFDARIANLDLGWIEDLVPPGDAALVADCRKAASTPVAMGDEQGGSYHPQALLNHDAVDVLRIDLTTNGGVTSMSRVLDQARRAGVTVAPHMYPHLHSRVLPALGATDVPIEWGVPGTGVHPMDDCLEQPVVTDGLMQPLSQNAGFGTLVNRAWIATQRVIDPDALLDDLDDVDNVNETQGAS
jgi:L-alanine-DL-glutamate epimerase-like enolase superfamily enzyme